MKSAKPILVVVGIILLIVAIIKIAGCGEEVVPDPIPSAPLPPVLPVETNKPAVPEPTPLVKPPEPPPPAPIPVVTNTVKTNFVIGVIPQEYSGSFWRGVEAGVRRAETNLGPGLKLIWAGDLEVAKTGTQAMVIQHMVELGVDGLALAPINDQTTFELLPRVMIEKRLALVYFNTKLNTLRHRSFVTHDDQEVGRRAAILMTELFEDQPEPADRDLMTLHTSREDQMGQELLAAFRTIAEGGELKILAQQYSRAETVAACSVAVAELQNYRVTVGEEEQIMIDGIFAANLTATLGTMAALDEMHAAGIGKKLKVIGVGYSDRLVRDLKAGLIQALVYADPEEMAYRAVKTAFAAAKNESVPTVIKVEPKWLTKELLPPAVPKPAGKE